MDAILRRLRRKAEVSNGADDWHSYAAALERAFGLAPGNPGKTFAVLHDGTLQGDSNFYVSTFVEYKDGDSLEVLFKKFVKQFDHGSQCEICVDFLLQNGFCECDLEGCITCQAYNRFSGEHIGQSRDDCGTDLTFIGGMLPQGAWIIDESVADTIKMMPAAGGDSAEYAQNASLKHLCQEMALKSITFGERAEVFR